MDGQYTLQRFAGQLKNQPRTLKRVARVFQKIMRTLYDTHFPHAEARRPGRNPDCPDADILTVGWLLEYIGEDSENAGYQRLKAELKSVFSSLPERSRFNRRRRNLAPASEVIRRALTGYLPKTDVFIVDSFPIPVCDFKRAKSSKSDVKWADGTGTITTYGHCATKSLGTFSGFRGTLITTADGVPIDFGITSALRSVRCQTALKVVPIPLWRCTMTKIRGHMANHRKLMWADEPPKCAPHTTPAGCTDSGEDV